MFWRKKVSNAQKLEKLETELAFYKTRSSLLEENYIKLNGIVSSLEMKLTNYKDKVHTLEELSKQRLNEVKYLQKTIGVVEKIDDENFDKMESKLKGELESKNKELAEMSKGIKELKLKGGSERERERYEVIILRLEDETTELKRRLRQYVEEKQTQLDHYEQALLKYRDKKFLLKAPRIKGYNRYAVEKLLPNEVKNKIGCKLWEQIKKDFDYRCAITGANHFDFEHFIPLHTGHGGSYVGNIIPLHSNLNMRKGNKNPFQWFKDMREERSHSNITLKRWNDLISYLAGKHNLSIEEYIEFVNWCFTNPRTKEQLEIDNTPSLELWKLTKV